MQKTEKERKKTFSRKLAKGIGKFNSTSGLVVINMLWELTDNTNSALKKQPDMGLRSS